MRHSELRREFSLDVVPCVDRNGQRSICDSKRNQFEPTDGTGYRDWFNMKTDITNGHLKGTVCLLKYLRDHKGNFEVPSVLLTTFAAHGIYVNERGKRFQSLSDTLKTVSNRVNSFLQGTPRMPRMRNPALRSERFTRHWEENDYRNFKEKFRIYNGRINDAYDEPDSRESLRKWQILFGEQFR